MSISIAACMGFEVETLPAAQRWECAEKRRYYIACVQRNLFGEVEVWRAWGGIGSRCGGQQFQPVGNAAADELLTAISKRRHARGYLSCA